MKQNLRTNTDCYETAKLSLAAFLIADGAAELVNICRPEGSRNSVFVLSPEPTSHKLSSFFNGSGTVSALAFHNALTNLKVALHEIRQRETDA